MKSINQINAFVQRDAVIGMYHKCGDDYNTFTPNWRNKHFWYKFGERRSQITPCGNFLYAAASDSLKYFCGLKDYDVRRAAHIYGDDHYFTSLRITSISLYLRLTGVYIEVQTSFSKILPQFLKIRVKSSATFENFDFVKYFEERILPEYLYKEGLFRNIQLYYHLNKQDAKKWYLKHYSKPHRSEPGYIDTLDSIYKRLRKKLNLVVSVYNCFNYAQLLRLLKMERAKVKTNVLKEPSPFDLHEQYSSMYDDDEHIEEFINETFSDYPQPAIFI